MDLNRFRSIIPSHSIYSSTQNTSSHRITPFTFDFSYWKKMSAGTMSFLTINNTHSITSKQINFLWNKLKMIWITTRFIFTKMIKNRNPFTISSSRNWLFKKGIGKTMYSICMSLITKISITKFISSISPIPTIGNWINGYFREKSFFLIIS